VRRRDAALGQGLTGFGGLGSNGANAKDGDVVAVLQSSSFADGQGFEGLLPIHNGSRAARIADGIGAIVQLRSGIHHVAQFHFVHGRCDDHVRDAPHVSEVVGSVVRWAVGADHATAVQAENNMQVLDRHVVDDLVVGALHEARVDVAERHLALGGHAGTEGDGVLFSNAHVERPVGHLSEHVLQGAARWHRWGHAYHAGVLLGQLDDAVSEYVLELRGFGL